MDYIVCLQATGKEPKTVCSDWELDFMIYQKAIDEAMKHTNDMNEIERIAKGLINLEKL